jgi:hypothetical protein
MCTVLFIPVNGSYYFASLRDENPERPTARPPQCYSAAGYCYIAPADPLAGGTWTGINSYGNVLILLNGGFENHQRADTYRKSRGLIVAELLKSVFPVVEWSMMDMEGIEPFTLIAWSENNLFQLTWDGASKHRRALDHQHPYIWSSSTLYPAPVKEKRQSLFDHWISSQPLINQQTVLSFLRSYTDENNGFIMHRSPVLKTLSYSFIELRPPDRGTFYYDDFSNSTPVTELLLTTGYKADLNPLFRTQANGLYKN